MLGAQGNGLGFAIKPHELCGTRSHVKSPKVESVLVAAIVHLPKSPGKHEKSSSSEKIFQNQAGKSTTFISARSDQPCEIATGPERRICGRFGSPRIREFTGSIWEALPQQLPGEAALVRTLLQHLRLRSSPRTGNTFAPPPLHLTSGPVDCP